jgi:hypothetical protein
MQRAAGTGGRGRRITSPLCAGAMGMTQRFIAAGPLSDQDIMPRYRMTPPARGSPPVAPKREALQGAPERTWESLPSADCQVPIEKNFVGQWPIENRQLAIGNAPNLVDLVVKMRGLWWGCGEWPTRSY